MSRSDDRAFDEAMKTLHAERPDLAPFLTLPPKEKPRQVRARMAQYLQERYATTGSVTEEDLKRAGFEIEEIIAHFHEAKRIAGLADMVV